LLKAEISSDCTLKLKLNSNNRSRERIGIILRSHTAYGENLIYNRYLGFLCVVLCSLMWYWRGGYLGELRVDPTKCPAMIVDWWMFYALHSVTRWWIVFLVAGQRGLPVWYLVTFFLFSKPNCDTFLWWSFFQCPTQLPWIITSDISLSTENINSSE
jgi:hypothetical protein